MRNLILISLMVSCCSGLFGQEKLQVKARSLDDHRDGYALITYTVPEDGFYTFSLNGGFQPARNSTIYYCEYQLQLRTKERSYTQDQPNIASQAQDGDICYFQSNEKNNTVSGVFKKNEQVEFRLHMITSQVNGLPHKKVDLLKNTQVLVQQVSPAYTSK